MPGLLGVIALEAPLKSTEATEILENMIAAASANAAYEQRRYIDSSGRFAVARFDHPFVPQLAWPLQLSPGNLLFSCGVITDYYFSNTFEASLPAMKGYFCAFSCTPETMYLATNRLSSLPIFYCKYDGHLFFSPEVSCLLAVMKGRVQKLNYAAVGQMLSSGLLYNGNTLWKGISKLPGGSILKIAFGEFQEIKYYSFLPGSKSNGANIEKIRNELSDIILQSILRNLTPDQRTVIALSGGMDSRLLACGARKILGPSTPLNTLSWGFNTDGEFSDVAIAKRLAQILPTEHEFFATDISNFAADFAHYAETASYISHEPAAHGYNSSLYRKIREKGFTRFLRGDQNFGSNNPVYSFDDAFLEVGIRQFGDINLFQSLIRSDAYQRISEQFACEFAKFRETYVSLPINVAKDKIRIDTRVEILLGADAYLRRTVFDNRNPLLDESILDFLEYVPDRVRENKFLILDLIANTAWLHPEIELSSQYNEVPIEFMRKRGNAIGETLWLALCDDTSPIWALLNRNAWRELFGVQSEKRIAKVYEQAFRPKLKALVLNIAPKWSNALGSRIRRGKISVDELVRRFLVLKSWCDANLPAQ